MSANIHHVTDDSFAVEVLQSPLPVLLDFWAEWCGPCRAIAPVLEEIAAEYAGRLKVAKIDVEKNQKTPSSFSIRNIPTLMLFKNGAVEGTQVGLMTKPRFTAFIDSHL